MDRIQKLIDYANDHRQSIEMGKMGSNCFIALNDVDVKFAGNYKVWYGDTIESAIDIAIKALGIK